MTIWLDTPPEIAYRRIIQRGIDSADLEHLKKYREALATLLKNYPHQRIDGSGKIKSVQTKVQQVVEEKLKQLKGR